jgi:hypothetical protein
MPVLIRILQLMHVCTPCDVYAVTLLTGCQAVRADLNNKYIVCKRVLQDAEAKRGFVYKVGHLNNYQLINLSCNHETKCESSSA